MRFSFFILSFSFYLFPKINYGYFWWIREFCIYGNFIVHCMRASIFAMFCTIAVVERGWAQRIEVAIVHDKVHIWKIAYLSCFQSNKIEVMKTDTRKLNPFQIKPIRAFIETGLEELKRERERERVCFVHSSKISAQRTNQIEKVSRNSKLQIKRKDDSKILNQKQ